MTSDEFKAFIATYFSSPNAASAYLDLSRDTIAALEAGVTRKGSPYPVKHHIALACMAVASGLVVVPPQYASGVKAPAPGRSVTEQTKFILARADGTRTAAAIADELKIRRKAVYAAVDAAKKKGGAARLMIDPTAVNPAGRAGKPA